MTEKRQNPCLQTPICLLLNLILCIGSNNFFLTLPSYAEIFHSTSQGLDLSKFFLVVDVPHKYYERLWGRAIRNLEQAGLKTRPAKFYKEFEPVFRITLEVEPLGDKCPDHFLYRTSLEIQEQVVPERSHKIRAWAVTWSLGSDTPEVRKGHVTLEELEKDLDQLMKVFIQDYQYANKSIESHEP